MNDIPMTNRIRESIAQFQAAKALADETRAVDPASEQHIKALNNLDIAAYVLALAVCASADAAPAEAEMQPYPRRNMFGTVEEDTYATAANPNRRKKKRLSYSQKMKLREVRNAGQLSLSKKTTDATLRSLVNRGLVCEVLQPPLMGSSPIWLYSLTPAGRERVR